MLGGAYSSHYKAVERQHVDTIKTLAENEKSDAIARARKMSVETNRRRRALAIKRKAEAEREEKRRQQILAKRREKQQEATEKFQRSHIPGSRPSSGASSGKWSPRRQHTQLEDALKLVRNSSVGSRTSSAKSRQVTSPNLTYHRQNSDPLSKPYFNKYAHPSINNGSATVNGNSTQSKQEELRNKSLRNLNNSRNLFEQQLENYQQSLYEQQQKTLLDFNKQVMQEIAVDKNVVNNEKVADDLSRSESLSSVDSLEDGGSNDTLRESCDLDNYLLQKNDADSNNSGNNNAQGIDNGGVSDATRINGNPVANESGQQNIDSFHTQSVYPNSASENQRHQYYLQRQKEIQLQLQEQRQQQVLMQQKQQRELQQKVLEQQQKQQQLLQQQYERQKLEEAAAYQRIQNERLGNGNTTVPPSSSGASSDVQVDDSKENQRPKFKAWGTPSPHPPMSVATGAVTSHVTNVSPYSGKSTHTNMTIPYVHNNQPDVRVDNHNLSVSHTHGSSTKCSGASAARNVDRNSQATTDANASYYLSEQTPQSGGGQDSFRKNASFLEEVTNGLLETSNLSSVTTSSAPSSSAMTSASTRSVSDSDKISQQNSIEPKNTSGSSVNTNSTSAPSTSAPSTTTVAAPKPPIHPSYYNSYGAAYSARQQMLNNTNTGKQPATDKSTKNVDTKNNVSGIRWIVDDQSVPDNNLKMHTPDVTENGDDITDTDSVSTICAEDKEPEQKEIKGILKRKGNGKKTSGILKKSGSTGNLKDIRDSLEITRVHLITNAEEAELKPSKKNVRWHDLTYDDDGTKGEDDDRIFVKRNEDAMVQKPPRPVSAVTVKTNTQKYENRPSRAVSATVRTSTIPRAKTQIVRPQAAAHIITQSGHNIDPMFPSDKVTTVNSNFMEKVPAMARANQSVVSVPASVYNVNNMSYTQPQQKVNYAVSSIMMPKSESAPFVYSGNSKGLVPPGSSNVPVQSGANAKNDSAVYDENGVRIDRTPTDDELNFLWDKLRTCLSRNSTATPDKGHTDISGPRQAAPVAHTYIDGNALGQFNSLNRVAQPQNGNPGLKRQNSLDSANGSYTRRYGLLQQRKQQVNPNSLKSRQQPQGYTVYQPPIQSNAEPQPSNVQPNGADVSESLAGFIAAEHMVEKSVSESKVHQAIDDAQARQFIYNSSKPQPKVKSALSLEEQRLMESLDRLNDKLKDGTVCIPPNHPAIETDNTAAYHHQQQQQQHYQRATTHHTHRSSFLTPDGKVSGFKGHSPITQRRVIETGNNRTKLRITSATLKNHLHRHH